MVIFRENTEDIYAGIEYAAGIARGAEDSRLLREGIPEGVQEDSIRLGRSGALRGDGVFRVDVGAKRGPVPRDDEPEQRPAVRSRRISSRSSGCYWHLPWQTGLRIVEKYPAPPIIPPPGLGPGSQQPLCAVPGHRDAEARTREAADHDDGVKREGHPPHHRSASTGQPRWLAGAVFLVDPGDDAWRRERACPSVGCVVSRDEGGPSSHPGGFPTPLYEGSSPPRLVPGELVPCGWRPGTDRLRAPPPPVWRLDELAGSFSARWRPASGRRPGERLFRANGQIAQQHHPGQRRGVLEIRAGLPAGLDRFDPVLHMSRRAG